MGTRIRIHKPTDHCPNPECGHLLSEHTLDLGCTNGWEYFDSNSPYAGMSKTEGCDCTLTLASEHGGKNDGD